MVYIRPEIEVIEIVLMHILAISHELGMDSEHQGGESADFGRKRDNSRGEWEQPMGRLAPTPAHAVPYRPVHRGASA